MFQDETQNLQDLHQTLADASELMAAFVGCARGNEQPPEIMIKVDSLPGAQFLTATSSVAINDPGSLFLCLSISMETANVSQIRPMGTSIFTHLE